MLMIIYIIEPEKILKKMLESGAMVEQFCINEHIRVEQFESDLQILERSSLIYMRSMGTNVLIRKN